MRKSCICVLLAGGTILAGAALAQQPDSTAPQTPAPVPAAAPAPPSPFHQAGMDFSFLFDGYGERTSTIRTRVLTNSAISTSAQTPRTSTWERSRSIAPPRRSVSTWTSASARASRPFTRTTAPPKPSSTSSRRMSASSRSRSTACRSTSASSSHRPAPKSSSRTPIGITRGRCCSPWALPYYHLGVRTTFPIGKAFTGGFQVVQGWNNVYDNNSGKTFGFTGAYAWKKVTWSNMLLRRSREEPHQRRNPPPVRHHRRGEQTDKVSYYSSFDYGQDGQRRRRTRPSGAASPARCSTRRRQKTAIAGRLDFFKDADGFSTGTAQNIKEVTLTANTRSAAG